MIAAVLAKVCRRFFKYLCWICCKSARVPLSPCIFSTTVTSDESESLDDEGCENLIRDTLIFGEGVSDEDDVDGWMPMIWGLFILCTDFRSPSAVANFVATCDSEYPLFSSSSSSSIWGKVSIWFWHIRELFVFDVDGGTRIWIWFNCAIDDDELVVDVAVVVEDMEAV